MKKRFLRYFKRLLVRYIPGTSKLSSLEAKRITDYLCDNYDIHQQLIITEEIKQNLILRREQEIENQKVNIENQKKYLQRLENNLITLNN